MRLAPFYNSISPFLERFPLPIDRGITILAYHGVVDTVQHSLPDYFLPAEVFRRQMQIVAREADIVSLKEAVSLLAIGGHRRRRFIAVTFDDGYRNNVTCALPILKDFGIPATIFFTTGYLGGKDLLPMDEAFLILEHAVSQGKVVPISLLQDAFPHGFGGGGSSFIGVLKMLKRLPTSQQLGIVRQWRQSLGEDRWESKLFEQFLIMGEAEIRALASEPLIDLGAHTVTHQICTAVSIEDACREIGESKVQLERILGQPVTLFAFPNGKRDDYSPDHLHFLRKIGFSAAVTLEPRVNLPGDNPFSLGRIPIGKSEWGTMARFRACISTGFLLRLHYGGRKHRWSLPIVAGTPALGEDLKQ